MCGEVPGPYRQHPAEKAGLAEKKCETKTLRAASVLLYKHISAYNVTVRRKPGQLLPLEISICASAWALSRRNTTEFHGYELAKHLREDSDARLLTAYGTLYRALTRLEEMGLLESRWEDPEIPARENRPGRRLYLADGQR